jgi:prevent-host-death family protein
MSDTPQEQDALPAGSANNSANHDEGQLRERERSSEPARPGRRSSRGRAADGLSPRSASRRIGIRELRQHASVYVDLAEKGYTVDITNRGRLVAQLVPAREPGSPMERLIAAGIIEPAEEAGGVGDLDPYPPPPAGHPTAGDVIGSGRGSTAGGSTAGGTTADSTTAGRQHGRRREAR